MHSKRYVLAAVAGIGCLLAVTGCAKTADTGNAEAGDGSVTTVTQTVTESYAQGVTTTVTASPTSDTATTEPDGDHCTVADLDFALGDPEGAAGSTYYTLTMTNSGMRTCTLQGFPVVQYVAGDDGHQVGAAAADNGENGKLVTLKPGDRATATIQQVVVQNFPEDVCDPTEVRGIRIYAPGDDKAAFIPQEDRQGCAVEELPGGQFQMSVTAVAAAN